MPAGIGTTPILSVRIPTGLKDRIRQLAQARGMTLTQAAEEALTQWAAGQETPLPPSSAHEGVDGSRRHTSQT